MALACPITEHPVGTGAFCRICGRDYVTVPDPVVDIVEPVEPPAVETTVLEVPLPPAPMPPPLPEPSSFAELHVPTEPPPLPEAVYKHESPDPVLDTGLIETRFAEMTAPEAPLGDLAAVAPVPEVEEPPAEKTPRALPPTVVYALAGGGTGALVMALLDRLVL